MPESPDVLTGGAWVPHGPILVWQPTPPPVVRLATAPPLTAADVAQMIACPTCMVKVCQSCKTFGGRHGSSHAARLIPRRCPCGAVLGSRKMYCGPCRVESRRTAWRLDTTRRRSSTGDDGPETQEAA